MSDDLLQVVIETVQFGQRTQDKFDTTKYKYVWGSDRLPLYYSHMVVVVKFGWRGNPAKVNNFMLTAYMIEKW